jgi:hypothetical protein
MFTIFGYMSLVLPWLKKSDPLMTDIEINMELTTWKDLGFDGF